MDDMLGTAASRIATLVGQAVSPIAGGLIAGAVIGAAAVFTGLVSFGSPPRSVALVACPDSGRVVARAAAGQALLAIGRSGDDRWVEIYLGEPALDGAWAPANEIKLQQAVDALPVIPCGETAAANPSASSIAPTTVPSNIATPGPSIAGTAAPSGGPRPTVTAIPASTPQASTPPGVTQPPAPTLPPPTQTPLPTPVPTPVPPPPPTPTPPPDFTAPTLSNLFASPSCLGPDSTTATISITATDPDDPVSLVRITTYPPGGLSIQDGMTWIGGNVWQYTVHWSSNWTSGYYDFTIRARDTHFNSSDPVSSDHNVGNEYIRVAPIGCIIF